MFLYSNRLGEWFPLKQGVTTIGRHPDRDIVLADNNVSKRHLEVRVEGANVEARDERSRNGTRLNARMIQGEGWVPLRAGDRIEVADYEFSVCEQIAPPGVSGYCVIQESVSGLDIDDPGSRSISLSSQTAEGQHDLTQLKALLAISETLRDVLRTEDVLERAVSILFEIFPAVDRAAICFLGDDGVVLPKWWRARTDDPGQTIRISQNICRHVAGTSNAILTSDAMTDFGDAESVHANAMRSVMCCPLADTRGEVLGMIHVDSARPMMFSENDLAILAAAGTQIGLAINCSRLHAIAVEDAVLRREMEQARRVQKRYLPRETPQVEGYDLAGFYRAARHVGGDYIDYIALPDRRLAVVLGDVVGKGVPAALTMVRLATETRNRFGSCTTPSELLNALNRCFQDDFITMVVMVLQPETGRVSIANAGHEAPLLRRTDGNTLRLGEEQSRCPIGVLEELEYEDFDLQLEPGEKLLIYSDGFPDAEHQASERRFGSDAIVASFENSNGAAAQIVEHIVARVDDFVDGGPQFDDMCMVCLARR